MKLLSIIGWIVVPYIMIIVKWKGLNKGLKIVGCIWASLALLAVIGNLNSPETIDQTTATISQTENDSGVVAIDKEKSDKKAAKEEKKRIAAEEKAAKEKEEADKKAAEEAEYNKPENVYERWVESQFSAWDGSATELKEIIKENMNDPKSFEHVESRYSDKGDMKGIDVYMKFRGKNAFGGVVTQTVHGSYDYVNKVITTEMVE